MSLSHSPISPLKFPFPRTPIHQINPIAFSFHSDKHTKNKTPKQPPLLSNGTTESTPLGHYPLLLSTTITKQPTTITDYGTSDNPFFF